MKDFFIYTKSFFSLLVLVGFVFDRPLFPRLLTQKKIINSIFVFFELDNKKASENLKTRIDREGQ